MNINDLTISDAKQLVAELGGVKQAPDKDFGLVVCHFIGRFVFVANLRIEDGFCYLTNVRNVRYWGARPDGLGGLARDGEIDTDTIDDWPDQIIPVDKLGPVMQANREHWG